MAGNDGKVDANGNKILDELTQTKKITDKTQMR
jgi:hypothetical protein